MRLRLIIRFERLNEAHNQLPTSHHAETQFVLGAVLAVTVVVAFVLILHPA
jgi:hypothetical protein